MGADSVSINEADVTGVSQLTLSPTATNGDGPVTQDVTVTVNPAPQITSFTSDRSTMNLGESVTLSWETSFAATWSISPASRNVAGQTTNRSGSIVISPTGSKSLPSTPPNQQTHRPAYSAA